MWRSRVSSKQDIRDTRMHDYSTQRDGRWTIGSDEINGSMKTNTWSWAFPSA